MGGAQPAPAAQFRASYAQSIAAKVRALKSDGTVAMDEENLFAITIPHGSLYSHAGAPRGTNCAYYLRQMFREIVASTPALKRFVMEAAQ